MSGFVLDRQEIGELGWEAPAVNLPSVPTPAVATGWSFVDPGTMESVVVACSFRLVTDANAASRIVVFSFTDSQGTAIFPVASPFTQAASKTTDYTFAVGIQQFGANDAANIGCGIPALKLRSGLGISVSVTAVQVGDQISRVRLGLSQWPVRP